MPRQIRLRQLHAHRKHLHADDDPRDLLRQVIFDAPGDGIDGGDASGAEGDADEGCQGGLGQVQGVADEVREEGVEDEEGAEEEVGEVGGCCFELGPWH